MNSQFGNHNYDAEHEEWLRSRIRLASPELLEEAYKYDWSPETIASMV